MQYIYWAKFDFPMIQSLPIMMFAFTCQVNIFQNFASLRKPTERRMQKVNRRAMTFSLFAFGLIGTFGYMAMPNKTPGNLFNRLIIDWNDSIIYSLLICLLYFAMAFSITMCFTFNTLPLRYRILYIYIYINRFSLISMMHGLEVANDSLQEDMKSKRSKIIYYVYSMIILVSVLLIALNVEQLNLLFQLLGGTTSAVINFVIPSTYMIYFYNHNSNRNRVDHSYYVWSYILIIFGVVSGVWSTYVTIIENF